MKQIITREYQCEYCKGIYLDEQNALACEVRCKNRQKTKENWYTENAPKYKKGDWVYNRTTFRKFRISQDAQRAFYLDNPTWVYKGERPGILNEQQEYERDVRLLMTKEEYEREIAALTSTLSMYSDKEFIPIINYYGDPVVPGISICIGLPHLAKEKK